MEEYWRWFMYQTKILPEQRVKCLEYFETPENMFIAPAAKVEKAEFLSEAAREELLRTRTAGELSREEKELQEKEIDFYYMEHPAYPARLREIPHAPCGLFVKGRLPQFEKEKKKVQAAAIVGARWASHVGLSLAKETAGALALEGIPGDFRHGIRHRRGGPGSGTSGRRSELCRPWLRAGSLLSET